MDRGIAVVPEAQQGEVLAGVAPPLLEVRDVTVRFGGVVANDHVTISCQAGAITALLGPNGAGKSTLFDVITGGQRLNGGRVLFEARDITALTAPARARLGMARTFQNPAIVPEVSVLANVEMGAARFRNYGAPAALLGLPRTRRSDRLLKEVAWRAVQTVGLDNVAGQRAGSLPYGHLRRLEIARALAAGPRVLLLDEPSAGMDAAETQELGQALLALRNHWRLTILLVEHDLALVRQTAEDAWVLDFGVVISGGPLMEVMSDEKVQAAYLGRANGKV